MIGCVIESHEDLHREIQNSFRFAYEEWTKLSPEVEYIPASARRGAIYLLNQAKDQLAEYEKEWAKLKKDPSATLQQLIAVEREIGYIRLLLLSRLRLRSIYRKNLNLLEQQLATQKMSLSREELQRVLQPRTEDLQVKIKSLRSNSYLHPGDKKLLRRYQRNLEMCRQMLTGERDFAPFNLLNQIESQQENLEKIDEELANLQEV